MNEPSGIFIGFSIWRISIFYQRVLECHRLFGILRSPCCCTSLIKIPQTHSSCKVFFFFSQILLQGFLIFNIWLTTRTGGRFLAAIAQPAGFFVVFLWGDPLSNWLYPLECRVWYPKMCQNDNDPTLMLVFLSCSIVGHLSGFCDRIFKLVRGT